MERIYIQKDGEKTTWGMNLNLDLAENDPSETLERLKKDLMQMLKP